MTNAGRLERLLARIDALNQQDPNRELVDGTPLPCEYAYSQRLTNWVLRLAPQTSEPLRIAARGQHVRRWTIPREQYPRTRAGYLKWRETLKRFHADTITTLMREEGYPEETVARVARLIMKKDLGADPDTQTLEDALCLIFLETQLSDLRQKTAEPALLEALRKSWKKMSPRARELALALPLGEADRALVERALASGG